MRRSGGGAGSERGASGSNEAAAHEAPKGKGRSKRRAGVKGPVKKGKGPAKSEKLETKNSSEKAKKKKKGHGAVMVVFGPVGNRGRFRAQTGAKSHELILAGAP